MKKVNFAGKRPSSPGGATIDDFVLDRPAIHREPMKRLTIDVPIGLHTRIKSQCAINNLVMADVIRELLEQRFPLPQDADHGSGS